MKRFKFVLYIVCCMFFLSCGKSDPVTSILATEFSKSELSESIRSKEKEFATLNEVVQSFFNGTELLVSEDTEGVNQLTLEEDFLRLYPRIGDQEDFSLGFIDELIIRMNEEGVKSKKDTNITWYVENVEDREVSLVATNNKVKITIPVEFQDDGVSYSVDLSKIHGVEFYKGRYLDLTTLEGLSYINYKLNK